MQDLKEEIKKLDKLSIEYPDRKAFIEETKNAIKTLDASFIEIKKLGGHMFSYILYAITVRSFYLKILRIAYKSREAQNEKIH